MPTRACSGPESGPKRLAGRLRRVELERLHASVQSVLREAIALGGSSVSDYVDADGVRGFFQFEHKVYMRTGQPCLVCGSPIRRIVLAAGAAISARFAKNELRAAFRLWFYEEWDRWGSRIGRKK